MVKYLKNNGGFLYCRCKSDGKGGKENEKM